MVSDGVLTSQPRTVLLNSSVQEKTFIVASLYLIAILQSQSVIKQKR